MSASIARIRGVEGKGGRWMGVDWGRDEAVYILRSRICEDMSSNLVSSCSSKVSTNTVSSCGLDISFGLAVEGCLVGVLDSEWSEPFVVAFEGVALDGTLRGSAEDIADRKSVV